MCPVFFSVIISIDQPNSWKKMQNVSNFTENSRKEFPKFTGPTDVISWCCANANEEISEQ